MEFRILGPFEVHSERGAVALGGVKPRALLAVLVLHANEPVSAERLALALWGQDTPRGAVRAVRVHISRLRKALGDAEMIVTTPAGYRLRMRPGELDAERFELLVGNGRRALAAGHAEDAAAEFREALSLWRGRPLEELPSEPFAQAEITRLEELRLGAMEARADAAVALGRDAEAIAELRALAIRHPTREAVTRRLMLALYRVGRHAEALDAFQRTRVHLGDELGLEPSHGLRELEQAMLVHDPALRGQAPPAAPHRAPRLDLPAATSHLFGREQDLEAIVGMLRNARLVTLTGPGGVGKTALALEVARAAAPEFRDGAWLVELASVVAAADVPAAISETLGAALEPGESPLDAATRFLASQQALLVVDNLEHVLEATPLLNELLAAAPGLKVLATSREPLDLTGEHRRSIRPLDFPARDPAGLEELEASAATALFMQRARERDPAYRWSHSEAPAVGEICRRLDGLPLAIELASARLGVLSPAGLAAGLDDALGMLGRGRRDAPARQKTLRATLDWSHELLDAREKNAFAGFAVFVGGASINTARDVLQTSLGVLDSLAAKNLLVPRRRVGEDRLEMLETIRQYAHERLHKSAQGDATGERHARHFLALAESTVPRLRTHAGAQALQRLDAEVNNFRQALAFTLGSGRTELTLELAGALGDYWYTSLRDAEALRWIDAALERETDKVPKATLAHAWYWRARHVRRAGSDRLEPTRALERALELYRRAGHAEGVARCLTTLGLVICADAEGTPCPRGEGPRIAAEALRYAHASGDEHAIARALHLRALGLHYPDALPVAREAASRFAALGSHDELACVLCDIAYSAILAPASCEGKTPPADNYGPAKELLEEALSAAREALSPHSEALATSNLGVVELLLERPRAAERAFGACLDICRRRHTHYVVWEPLLGCAAIAADRDDHTRAARLFGASTALRRLPRNVIDERLEQGFFTRARAAMGESQWHAAVRAGERLTFAAAINEALQSTRVDAPTVAAARGAAASEVGRVGGRRRASYGVAD